MKKIYLKNERKFIEVTDEVYYTYYRPIWAARKKAQSHGQCVCPQNKLWQCDADCCDCIYRTTGDMRSLDYEITIGEEGDIVTAGDMIADDYDMESLIADRMLLGKLLEELERLDPDGKKIFELFGEGLSDRKIGQALIMMINIDRLKKLYPVGTKVKLIEMADVQAPPKGTIGVVDYIDDIGTIHVKWSNGSSLGLIIGEDKFEIINSVSK